MSSLSKFTLLLSPQAQNDIEAILQYTYQRYGEEQEKVYLSALRKGLKSIKQNPHIGNRRFNILPDYRVLRVKQHLIIYKVSQDNIYVARILHNRMDISRHL